MRDEYLNTRDRQTFQIVLITVFGFLFGSERAWIARQWPPTPAPNLSIARGSSPSERPSVRPSSGYVVWDYTDVCVVALRL